MKRPLDVTIVAWLFIISGLYAAGSIVYGLSEYNRVKIDFTVLDVLIGRWLLNLDYLGYRWAKVSLAVALASIVFLVVAISTIVNESPTIVYTWSRLPVTTMFGFPVREVLRPFELTFAALATLLIFWQIRVLRRANEQGLFRRYESTSTEHIPT